MFGCLTFMYAKAAEIDNIKKVQTCKIKTGAGGLAANKGSTTIKFYYQDTSFLFLNCHLTSGQK